MAKLIELSNDGGVVQMKIIDGLTEAGALLAAASVVAGVARQYNLNASKFLRELKHELPSLIEEARVSTFEESVSH